ncbi:S9 family peptidase [Pseudoalteromonas sp. CST5]|uniref:S9 family peptidase n=1 Tax=unclassified Pseudoalteromonas TaxID=194690 RepID=UPI0023589CDD|nr:MULTISPECIES: S9 family peptidase [unclassified Pseudoalteromonas]MDC9514697.1 S9 family peptidase [Pseudoalteromonas sp. CST1]MDC9539047.1 S9 family peptidase [Pseudoalteromonas sp. CST3]MDC9543167.1 S9 family peptidase [Pseudoalteromonas sp. CST2]MDC9545925.1 S9 family peptidase [Pseudoalteromonas sp. CST4]MDC9550869.1 S9 family peptidase [Pseudoalteromonas sp. CST5]
MNKFLACLSLLLASIFSSHTTASNDLVPIESFSKDIEFAGVKISPDGKYLAVITRPEGKNVLMVLSTDTFKVSHAIRFPNNAQVGNYYWVNNERIVLAKEYIKGWKDHPEFHGELFGVNADGSRGKYLVGYQGEMQTGTRIKKATPILGTSYVLDPLIHDRRKMLILTYPWSASNEPHTIVYEVDIYSGKRKRVARSPSKMAGFLTDHDGNVRVAVSNDDYINQKIYTREKSGGEWQQLDLGELKYTDISLHAFDSTGASVYVTASENGEAKGLYKLNLESKKFELLHKEPQVSPKKVWVDEVSKELFAIENELGYPAYSFINNSHKSVRLKALIQSLQGQQVQLVSSTEDGEKSIIFASSDTNPGSYYLFDAKKNSLRFLFATKSWIKPSEMAITKPVNFKARDGLTIYGYLTIPNNTDEKNLPLVVMPHGGPHGPRDWWGYESEAQLLASRGIAVLKVNFRGSGGFGRNFEHAGHKKWGAEIQYDIIDGVKYLIEQGTVNKDNICIMGASFGGYSALQSAILEPDMFQCAIGVVGVYDLPLMFEEGDISERDRGQRYLKSALGTDEALLKRFSPSYNIDKLKAPVLIVHGGQDERAPIEQAESLVAALKKENHPYIYELLEDEGHGFYKAEHRTRYYKQVLNFLDEHMTF